MKSTPKATSSKLQKKPKLKKTSLSAGASSPKTTKPLVEVDARTPIEDLLGTPDALAKLGGKYREKLHTLLAKVYKWAGQIRDDERLWAEFCRHPVWIDAKGKRPELDHPEDVLQSAIRMAVGFADPSASKTASKYFAALSEPYAEQVDPANVAAYLNDNGGIEQLAKRSAIRRREAKNEVVNQALIRLDCEDTEEARSLANLPVGHSVKMTVKLAGPVQNGIRKVAISRVKVVEKPADDQRSADDIFLQ